MPLPNPRPSEKESKFMERCMAVASKEFPRNQALAICLNLYRKGKLSDLRNLKP